MSAYYNEFDKGAAAWLRELIRRELIAPGDVDERSIEDVRPDDLRGYTQHHFFAGIGGWSYALRLAGWPDDQPVWTGSCPCQPFSSAGARAGFADERHLWPAWQHLIAQCRPPVVFGEQVASKAADEWIDLVHADLEGVGYAFGGVAFPSASVGAPHIRDRSYWLAHANGGNARAEREQRCWQLRQQQEDGGAFRLGHTNGVGAGRDGRTVRGTLDRQDRKPNANDAGAPSGSVPAGSGSLRGLWRDADWLACRDGKWRPVEPGTFPLAHGLPARMVRLRGYGNAINPHQAAEFIAAAVEAMSGAASESEAA